MSQYAIKEMVIITALTAVFIATFSFSGASFLLVALGYAACDLACVIAYHKARTGGGILFSGQLPHRIYLMTGCKYRRLVRRYIVTRMNAAELPGTHPHRITFGVR